jgi:hypothetical protein
MTTRATPPPLNTATPGAFRRPTPFAPPHRRPAVPVHPYPLLLARHLPCGPLEISGNTLLPPSHRRAAQAVCPAGLGCQAVAQPAFRSTTRGRPPRPVGYSLRPVSAQYYAGKFNCFSNCFKFQKSFQTSKIHRTCRNVQNLPNKFCMNPLEPLFTVGLTKLTFMQLFLVQNCKNSNTRIIVTNIYACK